MRKMARHRGRVAPLKRDFVDTDQIIPAEFTKSLANTGYADALFANWRADPGFVLNDERYRGGSILLAGRGFGVGSSREHAVWALLDYGFRVVVSVEFGDIFRSNCAKVGLLAIELADGEMGRLWELADSGDSLDLDVDVKHGSISGGGFVSEFAMDEYTRAKFVRGWDDVSMALRREAAIEAHERSRPAWLPRL